VKAVQFVAPADPRIINLERPAPATDEVLIRVLACGVCGSDLNVWRGIPGIEYPLPPGAPGHEVWGEIEELGHRAMGPDFTVGQKVTGLMSAGYAQYTLARREDLVSVPARFGNSPMLGEPLACAANVVRRARWQPGERVALVGFGYIAALIARLLFPDGGQSWVAISRRHESRALALRLGAESVYDFNSVPEELWDGFPVVIEAAGVQQSLDYATWLTAYGGRLVIAGYHADGWRSVNMQNWNWKGIDVVNAHERQPAAYLRGLRDGLQILERHNLEIAELISHRWPLNRVNEAFRAADTREAAYTKAIVLPWDK
jgi:threonine dehydrogenase-like Zn-dependent dehydrogenase